MKNSEIILCSGIKLDRNYENTLSYNEEQMVNLCRNNSIYTGNTYTILQPQDRIRISATYESCIYANYVAFINPRYGNKWIFAWVTDVRLISPRTTEITVQVDVFSTWYSRFNLNEAFIEREHVSDDTIGLHTIPENLETGDYICDNIIKNNTLGLRGGYYIVASTFIPYLDPNDELIVASLGDGGNTYNGIYNGLVYSAFSNSTGGLDRLKKVIAGFAKAGRNADLYAIFMAPSVIQSEIEFENINWGIVKSSFRNFEYAWEGFDTPMIYKATSLNGYVPKNNKLLTYPYCYLNFNNGNGASAIYKYELFKNSENFCDFSIAYAICPGMSIVLRPHYYESSQTFNHKADLIGGKYPTCGWLSDSYTNWLTQNALNIKMGIAGNSLQAGLGIFEMGAFPSQGVQNIVSGISGIAGSMKDVYLTREFTSPQAEGNTNCGDVNYAMQNTTFTCYQMSIKQEFAKSIDQYFSRFGYKVNEVKIPNLNSRAVFNFIKVGGMDELVSGVIPSTDLEEINNIFRKGTTIFHNYNNIGNYTITNNIVN